MNVNVRLYDNGVTGDRYTAVFAGDYAKLMEEFVYLSMNAYPFDPQGMGQHGFSDELIDEPNHSHLGKRIEFEELPEDCKKLVALECVGLYNLSPDYCLQCANETAYNLEGTATESELTYCTHCGAEY